MGKWRAEGRFGLQGTDWSVTEWVPNPNPKRPGKYKWVAEVRDRKTAELIEMAPELLAALEAMLDTTHRCGEDCVMSEPCPIGERAREVVAKAKGGE